MLGNNIKIENNGEDLRHFQRRNKFGNCRNNRKNNRIEKIKARKVNKITEKLPQWSMCYQDLQFFSVDLSVA
jgi:hypothetical protein